jgi:hypothetical protein
MLVHYLHLILAMIKERNHVMFAPTVAPSDSVLNAVSCTRPSRSKVGRAQSLKFGNVMLLASRATRACVYLLHGHFDRCVRAWRERVSLVKLLDFAIRHPRFSSVTLLNYFILFRSSSKPLKFAC